MITGKDAPRHPRCSKAKCNDGSGLPGRGETRQLLPACSVIPRGTSIRRWGFPTPDGPSQDRATDRCPELPCSEPDKRLLAGGVSRLWRRACGQTLPSRRLCLACQRNGRVRSCRDLLSTICQSASAENNRFRAGVNRYSARVFIQMFTIPDVSPITVSGSVGATSGNAA
jgi:hypothetical protein